MKTLTMTGLLAALTLTAGAPAVADPAAHPAAPRACFFAQQISGWRESRDRRENVIYLDVNAHDVYRLDTFGPCHGLEEAQTIGVETRGGGSNICEGLDVTLVMRSSIGPVRCPVSRITKLTPEEIQALAADKRP